MSDVPTSQNGYSAGDASTLATYVVAGENVRLRKGDPGWLLVHFATWFDQNVEKVKQSTLDDWGYAYRPIRGQSSGLSNHASGTAIDLNATQHPLGRVDTFSAKQTAAIREQLKVYEGCIRWGGDYHGRKDEMHFEINADSAACTRIADKLRNEGDDVTPQELSDAVVSALNSDKGQAALRKAVAHYVGDVVDDPATKGNKIWPSTALTRILKAVKG